MMPCENPNIYLIGFMGSGKSSVARRLGSLFGLRTMEMDEVIERRMDMPIASIFEKLGEERFREQETQVLRDIQPDGVIVSCGGGAALREENRRLMKQHGRVVYLTVRPATVLQRLERGQTSRPVLRGHMDEEYIEQLMAKREAAYLACADLVIETDKKSPEAICREIAAAFRMSAR